MVTLTREEKIENNIGLVHSIAARFKGRGVDYEDLFQNGCVGLIKAVDNFDESKGFAFSTYAVPMIAGEIKRFLRDDGSVKVSRAIKKTARELNRYIENYSAAHGVQPSVKELAAAFSMDEGEVVFTLGSSRMPVSIYEQGEYKDEKSTTLEEKLPSKDNQDELIDRMVLKAAIAKLPERERKIVILRYFRDMTQSEVAKAIGVSQVQISRIESRILKDFKKEFA